MSVKCSILQVTGLPTYFITMTANPRDDELYESFRRQYGDGSLLTDMVSRMFAFKVKQLKHDIKVNKIFGDVRNIISVTEFQKRGLPHVHMLVTTYHKVRFYVYCY
jgi:Helitron helicase-like domain at N-terminus